MESSRFNLNDQIGNSGYAFFDVDDTLVSDKTMFSFQSFWYKKHRDIIGRKRFDNDMSSRTDKNASWENLNRLYYTHFRGRRVSCVSQCADEWFQNSLNSRHDYFHSNIVNELNIHLGKGQEAVFVSGSFPALLQPIAKHLNVKHILSTNMQTKDDVYTGEILPPQTIGKGKAEAIRNFLHANGGNAEHCFAYGDDISDEPLLSCVGHPVVVRGGRGLEAIAKERGWKIVDPY